MASHLITPEIQGEGKHGIQPPRSRRTLEEKDRAAVNLVAEEIARKVDEILKKG